MLVTCSATKHHKKCPIQFDTEKHGWIAKQSEGHTFYTNFLCIKPNEPELIPIGEEAKEGIIELFNSVYSEDNMPGWAKEVIKALE